MSLRTTVVLLGVLVVLGAAAFLVQGPCSSDRPRENAALLPGFSAADVMSIRASGAGTDLLLVREGGAWKLGAGKEAADASAVEALLTGLAEAHVQAVVSTNAAKQAAYETDAGQGVAVRLEGAGGKLLSAFVVGKHGPDFASCFVRRDGSTEVLLVSRNLRLNFSRPAESWREPPKEKEQAAPAPPAPDEAGEKQ